MAEDEGEEIDLIFQKKKLPFILGEQDFVYWVKNPFFERKVRIEVPDSKLLAPDKERIQELVCKIYGITKGDLIPLPFTFLDWVMTFGVMTIVARIIGVTLKRKWG